MELRNVYAAGLPLLPLVLLRQSRAAEGQRDVALALSCANRALQLLSFTLAPAAVHAEIALQLGRVQGRIATADHCMQSQAAGQAAPEASSGSGSGSGSGSSTPAHTAAALSAAGAALNMATKWSCNAGGHDHALVRACAMVAARLHLAAHDPLRAAACIKVAAATAVQLSRLKEYGQQLLQASAGSLPSWMKDTLLGQQQLAQASSSSHALWGSEQAAEPLTATANSSSSSSSQEAPRLASWHHATVRRRVAWPAACGSRCSSISELLQATVQRSDLHAALKATVAKFAQECCWQQAPEVWGSAVVQQQLPAVTILAHWSMEPVYTQGQPMPAGAGMDGGLQAASPVQQQATLLYVICTAGAPIEQPTICTYGALKLPVHLVKSLHNKVGCNTPCAQRWICSITLV